MRDMFGKAINGKNQRGNVASAVQVFPGWFNCIKNWELKIGKWLI